MTFTKLFSLLLLCLLRVGLQNNIPNCNFPAINNRRTFNALRKVESNGDLCKIQGDKLGPYQISEQYYKDSGFMGEWLPLLHYLFPQSRWECEPFRIQMLGILYVYILATL